MLQRVHEGHLCIDRCKNQPKEVLFWPEMNAQIHDLVNNCFTVKNIEINNIEPLMSHEVPELPMEKVSFDLFTYKNYLLHHNGILIIVLQVHIILDQIDLQNSLNHQKTTEKM